MCDKAFWINETTVGDGRAERGSLGHRSFHADQQCGPTHLSTSTSASIAAQAFIAAAAQACTAAAAAAAAALTRRA